MLAKENQTLYYVIYIELIFFKFSDQSVEFVGCRVSCLNFYININGQGSGNYYILKPK